ncbi:MAG: YggT family protein [Candidatus Margulisbacteria bacterium]|jgi:YggT family protein|nr:YggT family protein [Candidatus Margulisiibacteriota bacterium]
MNSISYFIRQFIIVVTQVLELAVIIRCVMSWFRPDPYNPIVRKIYELTDPLLAPFQGMFRMGGLDLSPVLALLVIGFISNLLLRFV